MKIIVYVLDCLRADHLSCYGYKRETSPAMDALAAEGFLFDNAFAVTTWTRASAASLLTSTYPTVHGVKTNNDFLPLGLETLPELLQREGFKTVGITAMGNVASTYGFDRGFDEYHDLFRDANLKNIRDKAVGKYFGQYENAEESVNPFSEDINQVAFSVLEKYKDDDLFLFLWSIDTHFPFEPPEPYTRFTDPNYKGEVDGSLEKTPRSPEDLKQWIGYYDSEILHNDHSIGQLVDWLKAADLYDETTMFITGDHGEGLGEHGDLTHGGCPYNEMINVPLIVKMGAPYYEEFRRGRVEDLVQLVDLFPTIGQMADCKLDQLPQVQGTSILPLLLGEEMTDRGSAVGFAEQHQRRDQPQFRSVQTANWKLIHCDYPNDLGTLSKLLKKHPKVILKELTDRLRWARARSRALYNVADDPEEETNLSQQHPERTEELFNRLQDWQLENERLGRWVAERSSQLTDSEETLKEDAELKDHLRALGYLD